MGRALLYFFLGLSVFVNACAFRTAKEAEDNAGPVRAEFASISNKIFSSRCTNCHNNTVTKGGVNLSSYPAMMAKPGLVVPGDYLASELYKSVAAGRMPQPGPGVTPLSAAELAAIAAWIQGGAPENGVVAPIDNPGTTPPVTPPPPPPVILPPVAFMDYRALYDRVLDKSCKGCHNVGDAEGFVDVTSYDNLVNNFLVDSLVVPGDPLSSQLFRSVASGDMPRGPAISRRERMRILDDIAQWIRQGAVETAPTPAAGGDGGTP